MGRLKTKTLISDTGLDNSIGETKFFETFKFLKLLCFILFNIVKINHEKVHFF